MPIRFNYDDVGTPFEGEPCDCHEMMGDSILDLTLKFRSDDVTSVLMLEDQPGGAYVPLVISGLMLDGTPFTGVDCLRLVPPTQTGNARAPK